MKKEAFRKKLLFTALFLAIAQLFSLVAYATQDTVDWELSGAELVLSNGETTYEYYAPSVNIYPCASSIYVYSDEVEMSYEAENFGDTCGVEMGMENSEIVWLKGYSGNYYYATKEGKKDLDAFIAGDVGSFRLQESTSYTAGLSRDLIKSIESSVDYQTYDVKVLKGVSAYDISARDKSNTIAYYYGIVFVLPNGEYGYLNYMKLDNSHFDSDGNFSYRNGYVELTILNEEQAAAIAKVANDFEYEYSRYVYEDDNDMELIGDGNDGSMVFFWIFFISLGFLLPIPCLVISLVIARSKKHGYPKYWYISAVIAGAWLIVSSVLLLLLLL